MKSLTTQLVLACALLEMMFRGYCQEASEQHSPTIEYEKTSKALVIRVVSFSTSGTSTLRVFGDGRVLIANSGQKTSYHECSLEPDELENLLRFISDHGAMTYPYGIVKQRLKKETERRRAEATGDRVVHTEGGEPYDGTTSKVELFLRTFKSSEPDDQPRSDFYHLTGGYALELVAKTHPEIKEAQDLAAIVQKLGDIHRNPNHRPLSQSEFDALLPAEEPDLPE